MLIFKWLGDERIACMINFCSTTIFTPYSTTAAVTEKKKNTP
jgi:hypothetical protein